VEALVADGRALWVALDPSFEQQILFEDEGPFNSAILNPLADRGAQRAIWLRDRVRRSIQLPAGEAPVQLPLPAQRRGRVLGFNIITGAMEPLSAENFRGSPGGNVSDVGTFAAAKAMNIGLIQPGTTTIRLSDRNKGVFERDTGAFGDLLTLFPTAENTFWFRDAAGARWIIAGQQIDIMAAGAINSKAADNGAIIQACLNFGEVSKRNVFVPAGTFGYARTVVVRNATGLVGVPGVSILYCTTRNTGAIIMEGFGGTLYGITREHYLPRPIGLNDRSADDAADGFYLRGAIGFTVQFCKTIGPQGAALMVRGCQYGRITNNWFDSSLADSIHVTAAAPGDAPVYNLNGTFKEQNVIPIPSYRLQIADNYVNNSGDDNIGLISYAYHASVQQKTAPVVSYPGYFTYYTEPAGAIRIYQANNRSINVVGNSTYGGDARGITAVGGQDIQIVGNNIDDPVLAGILAYGEDDYDTYGCDNINIAGNTLVNTGNDSTYKPIRYDAYGGQMLDKNGVIGATRNLDSRANASIIISGRAAFPSQNIAVRANMLSGMRQVGISISLNVVNVDVAENSFRGAVGVAVFVNAGSNVRVTANRISDCREGAISVNAFNTTGHVVVQSNQLHNINTGLSAGTDAIHFTGPPSAGMLSTTISDNRISGPVNYERFVEAFYDDIIAENNIGAGEVGLGAVPGSVKQRLKVAVDADSTANAANAGAAPAALTAAVSQTDYNTLAARHNTLLGDHNDLLAKLRAGGIIKA
jgi:hypothetical protein